MVARGGIEPPTRGHATSARLAAAPEQIRPRPCKCRPASLHLLTLWTRAWIVHATMTAIGPADSPRPPPSVFLSYASEDRPAAQAIRDALPAFGLEVWYDESGLDGGDAWDQK